MQTTRLAALLLVIAATLAACAKSVATLDGECSRGGPASCQALGEMYLAGSGVAQDKEKAAQYFERACEGRESKGCDKARQMYEEACEKGSPVGCSYLGRMYVDGFGVARDPAKAAGLYEKACNQGDPISCSNVAMQYSEGNGVTRDRAKSIELWRKACQKGFTDACQKVPKEQP